MANIQTIFGPGKAPHARKYLPGRVIAVGKGRSLGESDATSELIEKSGAAVNPPKGESFPGIEDSETQSFEFVTITGRQSNTTNSETSKMVRVQAMRDYLRKQHQQAITGSLPVPATVHRQEPSRYKGKFKLNSWSHKTKTKAINARRKIGLATSAATYVTSYRKTPALEESNTQLEMSHLKQYRLPNPVFYLHNTSLDPFDSLPIKLGHRSEKLLLLYHNSYSMNSVAVNAEGDFFSHARTDPALLHSILYLVALHRDLKTGILDSSECLHHGAEAFRMINDRLQEGVFSDTVIAAVAMLATKENLCGKYDLSKIHMQGLEYMIRHRGGIEMIKGVFQRIVTWSDFCYANVWNCQPRLPRLSLTTQKQQHSLESDFNQLAPEDVFGPESPTISILRTLRILSIAMETHRSSTPDRLASSIMIYNVEYDLLYLNKEIPDDVEPNECLCWLQTIALKTAAHLYLYLAIREVPPTSQLLYKFVKRLQDGLEIQLRGWWSSTYERQTWLIWMLFVGGAVAAQKFKRWWFVKELRIACSMLGIWNQEEFRETLKRVLWQETWCGDHCKSLWNDIKLLDETESGSLSPEEFQASP